MPTIEEIKDMLEAGELEPKISVIDYSSNMVMHNDKFDAKKMLEKAACKMADHLSLSKEVIYTNDSWRKHNRYRWK